VNKPVYALSIRPPWAYFVIYGVPYGIAVDNGDGSQSVKDSGKVILKNFENRSRPVPRNLGGKPFILPQRIYIHVSKGEDKIDDVLEFCVYKVGLPFASILMSYSKRLPRGAIIGEIDLVDCIKVEGWQPDISPWLVGDYGYELKNPALYDKPIPCRGALGFFKPEVSHDS
jgi:hypothetical protein